MDHLDGGNTFPSATQAGTRPRGFLGMWAVFQYAMLFIALYISATALGGILNYWVDKIFPDTLAQSGYLGLFWGGGNYLLNFYTASIIVAFPIFAILFLAIRRREQREPASCDLRGRKILIYLTLVGAFVIMVSHLISTLTGFFGGTTTMRSFGHLLVTVLIAGSIFLYYLWDVKSDRQS